MKTISKLSKIDLVKGLPNIKFEKAEFMKLAFNKNKQNQVFIPKK